jgi:hypothetical protein
MLIRNIDLTDLKTACPACGFSTKSVFCLHAAARTLAA